MSHDQVALRADVPQGDDFFNEMVGNNVLIDNLYTLKRRPRRCVKGRLVKVNP
jgi:hypothetical protein